MNKLIVLLSLSGSYIGGAQRRYINLFKELQKNQKDDYYLLINKSLYETCIEDGIFKNDKNIIVKKVLFEHKEKEIEIKEKKSYKTQKVKNNRLKIILGDYKYFIKQLITWFFFNVSLYKTINQYKIVSVYGVFSGGINSWFLAKILKIKFIYSYNDTGISNISNKWIDVFSSEYWALKNASGIDFLSEDIFYDLQKKIGRIPKEKILITPNSFIDYSRFYPRYPKKKLISFCSRLDKIKNPLLFLEALIELKKQNINDFNVSIIGDGECLNQMREIVIREKFDNVIFHGELSNPEIVLSESCIFISIQEVNNYPSQSLIEAMACENAIVASDVGETRKLISENEGILVSLSKESIAKAIKELLLNKEKCKKLGKNARERVLKEQSTKNYIEYFLLITSVNE